MEKYTYRFIPVADDFSVVLMSNGELKFSFETGFIETRIGFASVHRLEMG